MSSSSSKQHNKLRQQVEDELHTLFVCPAQLQAQLDECLSGARALVGVFGGRHCPHSKLHPATTHLII